MSVVLAFLGALYDAIARGVLTWLRDRRSEQGQRDLGAARERERISDEVRAASSRAGEIVAGRDDGVGTRRLRNGEF